MAKVKGMNRTAGTARRKMSASERVSYGLKTGAPLTGSASGVKSINLRQAGEALTQGIVSVRGKKLSFDPAGLAMALPVGKVAAAAKALRGAGKIAQATALEARVAAKTAGKFFGGSERGLPMERSLDVGGRARAASEKVFPRLPGGSSSGNGGRTLQLPDNAEARFKAIDRTFSNLGAVRPAVPGAKAASSLPKRVVGKLPEPGSVEMVKKTAKQFGQKVSGKEAKNISRLLRGRGGK